MPYEAHTTFEQVEQSGAVAANGASCILFIPLITRGLTQANQLITAHPVVNGNTLNANPLSWLRSIAPTVNGVRLLPSLLVDDIDAADQVYNRLQAGDRLELNNPPGVVDKTVYDVTVGASERMNMRCVLMVVRRFYTLVK